MKELKKKKHLNSNEQRSMSYQSDTQKLRATKVKEHSSIVDEKLLAERVYYGDQTHVYVGYLRAFKSGYFEGTKIRKITDIAKLLVASENFTKRARGEQKTFDLQYDNHRIGEGMGHHKTGRHHTD